MHLKEVFKNVFLTLLLQNALINNDDPLVNIIKQTLNLKFAKKKKVNQDYLLKFVDEKKAWMQIWMQKTFVIVLQLEPLGSLVALFLSKDLRKGVLKQNLRILGDWLQILKPNRKIF